MASFFDRIVPTDHSFSVTFQQEKHQETAESKWVHSDKLCVVSDPDVWKVIRLIRRDYYCNHHHPLKHHRGDSWYAQKF